MSAISLRPLFRYRTGLLIGIEQSEFAESWQIAREIFPQWIGFHSGRCTRSHPLAVLYYEQKQEKTNGVHFHAWISRDVEAAWQRVSEARAVAGDFEAEPWNSDVVAVREAWTALTHPDRLEGLKDWYEFAKTANVKTRVVAARAIEECLRRVDSPG